MAQTIVLQGATYSDVPAVDLPTNGGTARFMDTSDATATADTIVEGYTAYVDGAKVTGTAEQVPTVDVASLLDIDTTGMTIAYEGHDISCDGASTYVDTGVALFSEDNIGKDFKLILLDAYFDVNVGVGKQAERTVLGCMYEVSPWPGILIRPCIQVMVSNVSGAISVRSEYKYPGIVISRTSGTITASYAVNGTVVASASSTNGDVKGETTYQIMRYGSMGNAATTHDTTLTLGCEKNANGTPYRFCKADFGTVVIAFGE